MPTDDACRFNSNALIDHLKAHFDALDNQVLAQCLNLPLPLLQDLRESSNQRFVNVDTGRGDGIGMSELRQIMGEWRAYFRVATLHS